NTANGRILRNNIYEPLTTISHLGGEVLPRLATSWKRVDDLTWRFHLRENVKFHDGAPFDAEAVKREVERTVHGKMNCHTEQQYFQDFELTANVVDPLTIDLVTDHPVPILPTYMSTLLISSPNTPMTEFPKIPIGTGPYMFDGEEAGVDIRTKQNPDWWGTPSNVTNVRYIWRTESAVRAAMVKIGEADLAPDIAVQDADDPTLDKGYTDAETTWLRIDTEVPPLNDVRVRRALNYAVDRQSMLGTLIPKESLLATQPTDPGVLGHNDEIDGEQFTYDPEKAKQLLDEARADGVPVDDEILLVGRTNILPNSTELMETVMAMYQAVGLNLKLRMTEIGEWREYHNRPYPEGRQPVIVQTKHDNNRGDAIFSLAPKYGCEGTNSAFCNPEIDASIAAAAAMTPPERGPAMAAIFKRLYTEFVPDVYLFHMVTYARVGERITYEPNLLTGIEVLVENISFK
ncbi:MAG TPA: ABC transporter substrate-binding protein, partial [Devosia sp.]|nr:ABC transporter substrate-binding protein [Devosia sp.]